MNKYNIPLFGPWLHQPCNSGHGMPFFLFFLWLRKWNWELLYVMYLEIYKILWTINSVSIFIYSRNEKFCVRFYSVCIQCEQSTRVFICWHVYITWLAVVTKVDNGARCVNYGRIEAMTQPMWCRHVVSPQSIEHVLNA